MKIAYVLDDTLDKSDGVQQAVLTIGEHMRKLGHDVHYIVPTTERSDIQNVHVISTYISLKFNGNSVRTPKPARVSTIKKLLSDEKFDVLHVQMPYSPLLAGRIIRHAPAGTRIVGTFHILPYSRISSIGTRLLGLYLRRNARRFTKLYGVSIPALQFMKRSFGLDGSVLGNPIDYQFFHRHASVAPAEHSRIVFVGRFDERKGVKQLVRAFGQMRELKDVEYIMCGKGPLLDEVKKIAQDEKIPVTFTGFVSEEDKANYLASATIAVFPSTGGESFGIVLTEAMASGASITLGGRNAGYASVLEQWPDTLFDATTPDSIAQCLRHFLDDDSARTRIGTEQQSFVRQFDIDEVAEELLREAYTDNLRKRAGVVHTKNHVR